MSIAKIIRKCYTCVTDKRRNGLSRVKALCSCAVLNRSGGKNDN